MKSSTKSFNKKVFHLFSGADGKLRAKNLKQAAKKHYQNVRVTKRESLSHGSHYFIWVRGKRLSKMPEKKKRRFICASCNGEFETLEEMQEHWRELGLKVS